MNKIKPVLISLYLLLEFTPYSFSQSAPVDQSANLTITQLTDKTWVHTTYLQTQTFGKVACNGLIVVDGTEAIIMDTPTTDSIATELINWVQNELNSSVKAVVVTHFHEDCLGGLAAFHQAGIASYAYDSTLALAKKKGYPVPEYGFADSLKLPVGNQEVVCAFLGEGHTTDNTVCYVPNEKVLFGGCLIKAIGAKEGNLEDANPEAWPTTVLRVKRRFSDVGQVVPGHGEPGDASLLDYTIQLFSSH